MKILFISAFLPSTKADSAGVLDAAYLYNELSQKTELTLICNYTSNESKYLDEIASKCLEAHFIHNRTFERRIFYYIKTIISYFTSLPAIAMMTTSIAFKSKLKKILKEKTFDSILLEFTQSLVFIDKLPHNTQIVIDESDIAFIRRQRYIQNNFKGIKKIIASFDNKKLKKFEIGKLNKCSKILLRTKTDKSLLFKNGLYNGIKTFYYYPWIELNNNNTIHENTNTEISILFYAAMWRPVNEEAAIYFAQKILPHILIKNDQVIFYIVGSKPTNATKKLSNNNIIVTGYVDKIEDYYQKSSVVVAPLLSGSGIKGKIVQALSYGKPVVTTSVGIEGLEEFVSSNLIVTDKPLEFAQNVINLIQDPPPIEESKSIAIKVKEKFNWQNNINGTLNFILED